MSSKDCNKNALFQCFCKQQFPLQKDKNNFIELRFILTHIDSHKKYIFQSKRDLNVDQTVKLLRHNVSHGNSHKPLNVDQTVKGPRHNTGHKKSHKSKRVFAKQNLTPERKYNFNPKIKFCPQSQCHEVGEF